MGGEVRKVTYMSRKNQFIGARSQGTIVLGEAMARIGMKQEKETVWKHNVP